MVRICPRAPGRTTIELLFRCPCSSDVGLVHARAPATLRPTFVVKDDRLFRLRSGVRLHAANSSLLEVDAYGSYMPKSTGSNDYRVAVSMSMQF